MKTLMIAEERVRVEWTTDQRDDPVRTVTLRPVGLLGFVMSLLRSDDVPEPLQDAVIALCKRDGRPGANGHISVIHPETAARIRDAAHAWRAARDDLSRAKTTGPFNTGRERAITEAEDQMRRAIFSLSDEGRP